jgi:branched-chain amino acid transport system substrate-binding protein
LTGEEAQVGIDEINGVKYAIALFNAKNKNKFKVNLVAVDDQGSGTEAAKVAPGTASNKKIIGLVGPSYSGATIASLPFYKQTNLPMISPSATRVSITDPAQGLIGFPVFHRIPVTDRVQGPALFKLATKGVTSPKVFVIDDQSPYGVGLVDYMKLGGAALTGQDSVSDKTTDWTATISKVKSAGANVVIFTGYYAQAATLYRQLRDSGYTGVLAGGDGVLSPGILSLVSASILEGVRLTGGTVPLSEISAKLEADFKMKMGVSSGTYAAESIDATNVFLSCIAKKVTTRDAMLKCVKAFKGKSITGSPLSFDKFGDTAGGVMNGFEIKAGAIKYTGAIK